MTESQEGEHGVEENVDGLSNTTTGVLDSVTNVAKVVVKGLAEIAFSGFDGSTQHGGGKSKGSTNNSELHYLKKTIEEDAAIL